MKVCGVVCEYNPFHNGHKYQIDYIKNELGFDAVVGVMSGSFTQRGDAAIFDKNIRAKAAVQNGMDLVLEFPAVHAVQSAEIFARNSVYILNALGLLNGIAFGTERDSIEEILQAAKLLTFETEEFKQTLKAELSQGKPYFSARLAALNSVSGKDFSELLKGSNNILAVEYVKALLRLESSIKPYGIIRTAADHNDGDFKRGISSATSIRSVILEGGEPYGAVPENCRELYEGARVHNIDKLGSAIICQVLKSDPETIRNLPDVSEGLENKIKKAALSSASLEELYDKIKSKRYTHSRIRRILLNLLLGTTAADAKSLPKYIKILAFSPVGQDLLHRAKKAATLPLAKNRNGIKNNPAALTLWDRELVTDCIYNLS